MLRFFCNEEEPVCINTSNENNNGLAMAGYFDDEEKQDIRTDVELLKKDVGGLEKLVGKLDVTIEKISEVATHLDRMVIMQQAHIDQQAKDDEYIKSKLGDLSSRVKELEKSKWFIVGIASAVGFIIALLVDFLGLTK